MGKMTKFNFSLTNREIKRLYNTFFKKLKLGDKIRRPDIQEWGRSLLFYSIMDHQGTKDI